jgi:hypothetical protein
VPLAHQGSESLRVPPCGGECEPSENATYGQQQQQQPSRAGLQAQQNPSEEGGSLPGRLAQGLKQLKSNIEQVRLCSNGSCADGRMMDQGALHAES